MITCLLWSISRTVVRYSSTVLIEVTILLEYVQILFLFNKQAMQLSVAILQFEHLTDKIQ